MEFTQEQETHIENLIKQEKEKWTNDELTPITTKVTELEQELKKYESTQKTEQELKIETKLQELWSKEKSLVLKEHGLDKFNDFINADNVESLQKNIDAFKNVMKELDINNSFIPEQHRKSNKTEYEKARGKNDTVSMIKALFTSS